MALIANTERIHRENREMEARNEAYRRSQASLAEHRRFLAVRKAERVRAHEARAALQRERYAEYRAKTKLFAEHKARVLSQMRVEFLRNLESVSRGRCVGFALCVCV